MAWPTSVDQICTNIAPSELKSLMDALDQRPATNLEFVTLENNCFASCGTWTFMWRGKIYILEEHFEMVTSLTSKGDYIAIDDDDNPENWKEAEDEYEEIKLKPKKPELNMMDLFNDVFK